LWHETAWGGEGCGATFCGGQGTVPALEIRGNHIAIETAATGEG